jgi:hypothetical protein
MSEYQKIEYLIGKDGKVTERVISGSGEACVSSTSGVEAALGEVENRELLPEYYEESLPIEESQYLQMTS